MDYQPYFPFIKNLTPDQSAQMLASLRHLSFLKGESLHDGQQCTGLFAVETGRLRAYILSTEGKEITLYHLEPYDICLFSASCLLRSIQFEIQVEAAEDSRVILLPTPVYSRLRDENVSVANYTNELLAARFSEIMWLLDQILYKKLDSRLAAFLIEEKNLGHTPLVMTHEEISRHLGTAREVISRMMKYFQKEGLIEQQRGCTRILNEKKLLDLARESLR